MAKQNSKDIKLLQFLIEDIYSIKQYEVSLSFMFSISSFFLTFQKPRGKVKAD